MVNCLGPGHPSKKKLKSTNTVSLPIDITANK